MSGTGDEIAVRPWPDDVAELLASFGHRQPVSAAGRGIGLAGGAERWTSGRATIYRFDAGFEADRERFMTVLSEVAGLVAGRAPDGADTDPGAVPRFDVPAVLGRFDRWVVVEGPEGIPADRPDLHADPDDLVIAIGAGMRSLHELPLHRDGLDLDGDGWETVARLCRTSVAAGLVDPGRLPAPYDRYQPERLLELFIDGAPAAWEPVVCHGHAEVGRFIVDRGRFAGFDRMEAPLVADRHFDLAVVHQSVQHHFGPEAVFRFYDAYGRDPDVVRLEHQVLASHLLGRSPAAAEVAAVVPDR